MIHPARRIPYQQLLNGLREAQAARLVSERILGNYSLWCYTPSCVYDRGWNEITMMARGLILNTKQERVVATPFKKFFNLSERGDEPIPDLPFEVFEKLDGSLIIIWHDGERWRTATKGSLNSDQARDAAAWMHMQDLSILLLGYTYLAEWCSPNNRIVIPYQRDELVLLAAYDEYGYEQTYPWLQVTASQLGWRLAERHEFASIADLVTHTAKLPATSEGFVLRFADGTRLKIKGDEYRRIHALISRCTPLAMWEAMLAGDNMIAIRNQLPDEFLVDFDAITSTIGTQVEKIVADVALAANKVSSWSDKEVGLNLPNWPKPIRQFIFPYRKNSGNLLNGKIRQTLFRAVRPTGNILPGYTPSYAMNRVMEEAL